jgi:hypothetical protein
VIIGLFLGSSFSGIASQSQSFFLISGVNNKQHNRLEEGRDFYSFHGIGKFVWKVSEGTNSSVSNVCSI